MYGTTLSWLMGLRGRRMGSRLRLQDVRKLFDEGLVAHREPVDVVRVAVVRDDGGNRGEQADRRRDQRLGDAGRDAGEGRLADVREPAKRVHDPPYSAEQPDVGRHRADGGEAREIRLE